MDDPTCQRDCKSLDRSSYLPPICVRSGMEVAVASPRCVSSGEQLLDLADGLNPLNHLRDLPRITDAMFGAGEIVAGTL